jgi:hypothetical protein
MRSDGAKGLEITTRDDYPKVYSLSAIRWRRGLGRGGALENDESL